VGWGVTIEPRELISVRSDENPDTTADSATAPDEARVDGAGRPDGDGSPAPEPGREQPAMEEVSQRQSEGGDTIDADLAIVLGKAKKTVKPTGSLSGLAVGRSMLIALEEKGEEAARELSDTSGLKEEYDLVRVEQAWKALVEDLRKRNRVGLASTLANGEFEFADPTIRFTVSNEVQFEELKECSTDLLHFIRSEVGNGGIALDVRVSEVEPSAEFLTPRGRYMKWASENPSLEVIRKRLDLDLG